MFSSDSQLLLCGILLSINSYNTQYKHGDVQTVIILCRNLIFDVLTHGISNFCTLACTKIKYVHIV